MDPDLLQRNMHIIWLDNLFTKIRLLEALRLAGIGAAGTIRPSNSVTPREERLEKARVAAQTKKEKEIAKKQKAAEKEVKKEADKVGREAKKDFKKQVALEKKARKGKETTQSATTVPDITPIIKLASSLEPASLLESTSFFENLFEAPVLELEELPEFPDTNTPEKNMLPTEADSVSVLNSLIKIEQVINDGDPDINEPFSEDLSKLRSSINQIEWGTKWFAVSKQKTVAQMAWRDNNVVLFATTIGDLEAVIIQPRKRPAASHTGAPKTRKAFGDEITKDMEIPVLINEYNHHMGAVDRFDQLRSYYDVLQSHRKAWRPLFSLLLEIIMVNSYKLSAFSEQVEAK